MTDISRAAIAALVLALGLSNSAFAATNLNSSKSNNASSSTHMRMHMPQSNETASQTTLRGTVQQISANSFRMIIKSKSNITNNRAILVSTSASAIVDRSRRKIARADISVGDIVRAFGTLVGTSTFTLEAQLVRDISVPHTAALKQTAACRAACQRSCGANASCLTECYANCRSGGRMR